MALTFDHTTLGQRVLFGTGRALDGVLAAIESLGAQRVLLIAGGSATELAEQLAARAPVAARIQDIVQHVPVENGRAAVAAAHDAAADAVVAIGGGSAVGLAKIVARDTRLPVVAVPTTFAGSEATNVWGQTEDGHKTTGVDDHVLPAVIVYDAALSRSLPGDLAAASGLNAVAHAVDGLWAPGADPINRELGAAGLRALVPALQTLADDPDDVDARDRLLYGAYLAAVAFASAGSGMHHKICHVLGGAYGLPHAQLHAIVLPYVTAFNTPAAPEAAARISDAMGGASAAAGLLSLREQLGVAPSLSAIGMAEQDVPEAARLALAAIPAANPRPVHLDDVERIIHAAWAGDSIQE